MEINKDNLPQAINALRQCARENQNQPYGTGMIIISSLCNDVADYLTKEIFEQLKSEKNEM